MITFHHLLITGGAGFIGSNFVRYMLGKCPECRIVVLDKLTYAGNLENLADVAQEPRYTFVQGDICDVPLVNRLLSEHQIDAIINFAAETHVDRSLLEPSAFLTTDLFGTYVLLEAARQFPVQRYLQVSTDEVYGHVPAGSSKETDPLAPRSPYAASKAAADLLVQAYHVSYGLPTLITRGSNNFGPYQYPEKFIPLFITNAIDDEPLPLYGDGRQVRDWIYVLDHCEAIDLVLHRGLVGEIYNVGGGNEWGNIEVARLIVQALSKSPRLIRHVADRPGHDRRYSLDCAKIHALGWQPCHPFPEALEATVRWYLDNKAWWRKIKSGEYLAYYQRQYADRIANSQS